MYAHADGRPAMSVDLDGLTELVVVTSSFFNGAGGEGFFGALAHNAPTDA